MLDVSSSLLHLSSFQGCSHGISTRRGGVSPEPYASLNMGLSTGDAEDNVITNREILLHALGVSRDATAVGRFAHGNEVSIIRGEGRNTRLEHVPVREGSRRTEPIFRSDAVISDVPGMHFLLTFADCVPLLFFDTRQGTVGAAHAGWRGTAKGIGPAVVHQMEDTFGTTVSDLRVGIGPSIGPCCYSVQRNVVDTFHHNGFEPDVQQSDGEVYLDLWSTNEKQLRDSGVPGESIENPRLCTSCNVGTFYSHRAEGGRTGRFALCIGCR